MNYLPIFVDLKQRPVLVVGGGHIAERKIAALLKAEAKVQVVAHTLNRTLQQWVSQQRLEWLAQEFDPQQVRSVYLVIAATNDNELNQQVFWAAENAQRLVNVVDDQPHCSYIFPSIIDRSPIQVAISSGGTAPVLARLLREKLEALLPQNLGAMAQISGRWREKVKVRLTQLTQRRRFWEKLFNHPTFQRLTENQQFSQAEQLLQRQLNQDYPIIGEVALVGAGPGDAGLLTLKGLQTIQQADVVLYDALVSEQVLELVRRDADKVFVGKRAGKHSVAQQDTNQLLLDYARQGKRVVRLKGGDPFVFGRGGEELEVLKAHKIPFSVVPGITAALGATAYAGIPLTHRDYAQTAMFITGHCQPDGNKLRWETLAQGNQTLVVYMGTIKAAELSRQLQAHGRSADTPVAVISNGTLAEQTVQTGQLHQLAVLAEQAPKPALIVIGEVVALQPHLAWFGEAAQQFVLTEPQLFQSNNELQSFEAFQPSQPLKKIA
ncbi:siroheme synthase CysG [Testudinibacter aquarius]|uniref:Siroheme synthase n=1 Tax=Testudinibacter aquarius TaxID=1524974 RepID=A0A4R3Y4Z9_9PAST|nr:siroheme synthase CysG [Testudinibacter aquarius]KAE9528034.1 sirohydrochlorin ferrochelatase [Testudinibacter aquarius]TCV86491.1 uroporphyrin-III C-methyltransferase/precorrin-2 dehydrogenase/sirohydrochlorin ferrochelatase [Testudinibacter aquarius]TNG88748.1 uroporphyrinogen-III C-methyltransferase [Testudinibacter aquarius]